MIEVYNQDPCGFCKSVEKTVVFFQSEQVWKNVFQCVSTENEINFADLIV